MTKNVQRMHNEYSRPSTDQTIETMSKQKANNCNFEKWNTSAISYSDGSDISKDDEGKNGKDIDGENVGEGENNLKKK
jgi:hypothetical protein